MFKFWQKHKLKKAKENVKDAVILSITFLLTIMNVFYLLSKKRIVWWKIINITKSNPIKPKF